MINNNYNNYADVIIKEESNEFYILNTKIKPKIPHIIIERIKYIIENKLKYAPGHEDEYSKLTEIDLWKKLKALSIEIQSRHAAKTENSCFVTQALYSVSAKQMHMQSLIIKMGRLIFTPRVLPLPDELTQRIGTFLSLSDVSRFAQSNQDGHFNALEIMLNYAVQFGYDGSNRLEAVKYLEYLENFPNIIEKNRYTTISWIQLFRQRAYIDNKFLPPKTIMRNLQSLTHEEILDIFSEKYTHGSGFKEFVPYVTRITPHLIDIKTSSITIQNKANVVLSHVIHSNDDHRRSTTQSQEDVLKFLLKNGIDPNSCDEQGDSYFHLAAEYGFGKLIKLFAVHGAAINDRGRDGFFALCWACKSTNVYNPNDSSVVECLLEKGANPNLATTEGDFPIHLATKNHSRKIVEKLLEYGAEVNAQDSHQRTALYLACQPMSRYNPTPNYEIIMFLLNHGANPDITDNEGIAPRQIFPEIAGQLQPNYSQIIHAVVDSL